MAGLLHTLPWLSYHFGLKPADVMDLPPALIESYLDALDDIGRAQKKR